MNHDMRRTENIKVPQKNVTAKHAELRKTKQIITVAISCTLFCDLLRFQRFSFAFRGSTSGSSSPRVGTHLILNKTILHY